VQGGERGERLIFLQEKGVRKTFFKEWGRGNVYLTDYLVEKRGEVLP